MLAFGAQCSFVKFGNKIKRGCDAKAIAVLGLLHVPGCTGNFVPAGFSRIRVPGLALAFRLEIAGSVRRLRRWRLPRGTREVPLSRRCHQLSVF